VVAVERGIQRLWLDKLAGLRLHRLDRSDAGAADHDAVGLLEISQGRTLLEEFRFRDHLKRDLYAAGLLLGADGFCNLGCGADRAKQRSGITPLGATKGFAPGKWAGAAEATILLNQRAPHELQPCQRSGLSPCALPARS